jgi:hypothetical protein
MKLSKLHIWLAKVAFVLLSSEVFKGSPAKDRSTILPIAHATSAYQNCLQQDLIFLSSN